MEGGQGSEGRGRSALLPVHAGAVQPVKVRVPGQTVLEHRLVRLLVAYDTLICLYRYKDRYIIDDRFGFGFIIYCFHRPRDLDFLHFLMLNYFYHRSASSLSPAYTASSSLSCVRPSDLQHGAPHTAPYPSKCTCMHNISSRYFAFN